MPDKKKFSETKIGGFLSKAAPEALKLIGDSGLPGVSSIAKIATSLIPADKTEEFHNLLSEYEAELPMLLADRADARKMNEEIQESGNASWLAKNFPYLLGGFVSLVWGAVTVFLFAKAFKLIGNTIPVDLTSIYALHSSVNLTFGVVLYFYFGSSISSKKSSDIIAEIAKQP